MRVFHILPTLVYGDAVSNDARALNVILVEMGFRSRLYVARSIPRFEESLAFSVDTMPQTLPDDLLIYHLSTGDALNERLISTPGHKLIIYHNITPPEFFRPYSPAAAELTQRGYEQTKALAPYAEYCIADSAYNASELRRMGYTCPIDVVPILIPFEDYRRTPDAAVQNQYRDGRTNLLFVGRIDEGKNCDVMFRYWQAYKERNPGPLRLVLMGKPVIPVPQRDDICSLGFVSEEDKFDGVAGARLLLLPSRFESLSIVVLEAMSLEVPVLVNGDCAVLKGHCVKSNAGLYYQNYLEFEGAMKALLNDESLRDALGQNGPRYVEENYRWDVILDRVSGLVEQVSEEGKKA